MNINEDSNGSKLIYFGKFIGVLYPEIYFQFVRALHNEHPDLIKAMEAAKVQQKDASAIDYLCQLLNVTLDKSWPMEKGYQLLYDALKKRKESQANNNQASKLVDQFNKPIEYNYRAPENVGKPLFPSIEEQIDRGDK
jgi:hypothetical protein